jgi:uncharacterized membrane protein HdeD (DUF308 family)
VTAKSNESLDLTAFTDIISSYRAVGSVTRKGIRMEKVRKFRKWILGAGLVSIVIGYILLGQGSISAAPALLVLGYCILVPVALI